MSPLTDTRFYILVGYIWGRDNPLFSLLLERFQQKSALHTPSPRAESPHMIPPKPLDGAFRWFYAL